MKLINNGENNLLHVIDKEHSFKLEVGKVLDVPKEIAKVWLTYPGIQTYVSPEDLELEKEKAVKEALKKAKEQEKAKAQSKSASKSTKSSKKDVH